MLRVRSECPLRLGPHLQCPVFFTHHLPLRFMKGWEGASPASPQPQGTGLGCPQICQINLEGKTFYSKKDKPLCKSHAFSHV